MKAKPKTIFLTSLAVLDCIFGGLIITSSINSQGQEKEVAIKASGNFVVVEEAFEFNDAVLTTVEKKVDEQKKLIEEERIRKEKEEQEKAIVYDGMTLKQLANKLNKSLKSDLSGKGYLVASYSLSKGVDPYVATAIMLHETGCEWGCSRLVKKCNNVGGQKGSGCGSYAAFSSLDTGIKKFIDNLSKNYYAKGLNTPEKMNSKYAASKTWSKKVNNYVKKIKSK